jgi:hypothetical protein
MIAFQYFLNQADDKMVIICCSCRLSKNIFHLAFKVIDYVITGILPPSPREGFNMEE